MSPAGLEVVERADALALALVAVDRRRADPVRPSCSARRFAPCFVRVKTRACSIGRSGSGREELALPLAVDRVDDLRHELGRRCCAA
jgi:hypothetical protein